MAKILFYAHDPGGANALAPLVPALKGRGHETFVFGTGPAVKILPEAVAHRSDADVLIKSVVPDFVITGTGAADMLEKQLRRCAVSRGVHSVAILDHWGNYGIRFSRYSTAEIGKYQANPVHDYLPDAVIVMDAFAKSEMAREGVPEAIIHPLGNPHFDILKNDYDAFNASILREVLLRGKDKLVVFASEPYVEDYGHGNELRAVEELAAALPENVRLAVKPHPREKFGKFAPICETVIPAGVTSLEAIKAADVVVSMTSMVLIEALICGKYALSFQPGAVNGDGFVLTKNGTLPFINNGVALHCWMMCALDGQMPQQILTIQYGATERIVRYVEEVLCQN